MLYNETAPTCHVFALEYRYDVIALVVKAFLDDYAELNNIIVEEFMKISDTDASILPPHLTTRASIINAHLFDKLVCEYRYIPNQVEVYVGTRSLTRFVQSSHSHVTAEARSERLILLHSCERRDQTKCVAK